MALDLENYAKAFSERLPEWVVDKVITQNKFFEMKLREFEAAKHVREMKVQLGVAFKDFPFKNRMRDPHNTSVEIDTDLISFPHYLKRIKKDKALQHFILNSVCMQYHPLNLDLKNVQTKDQIFY